MRNSEIHRKFEDFSLKASRCQVCSQRLDDCLCDRLTKVDQTTKINIIMHHKEAMITSNTARLAKLTFERLKIHLRGVPDNPIDWQNILTNDSQPLYLYPEEDSIPIDQVHSFFPMAKSFNLIVPDGSWRQTKKYRKRELALQNLPTIKLPDNLKGNYQLRKARFENYLSTYEAISYALDHLEKRNISDQALPNFKLFVERHLNHRHPSKILSSSIK